MYLSFSFVFCLAYYSVQVTVSSTYNIFYLSVGLSSELPDLQDSSKEKSTKEKKDAGKKKDKSKGRKDKKAKKEKKNKKTCKSKKKLTDAEKKKQEEKEKQKEEKKAQAKERKEKEKEQRKQYQEKVGDSRKAIYLETVRNICLIPIPSNMPRGSCTCR